MPERPRIFFLFPAEIGFDETRFCSFFPAVSSPFLPAGPFELPGKPPKARNRPKTQKAPRKWRAPPPPPPPPPLHFSPPIPVKFLKTIRPVPPRPPPQCSEKRGAGAPPITFPNHSVGFFHGQVLEPLFCAATKTFGDRPPPPRKISVFWPPGKNS